MTFQKHYRWLSVLASGFLLIAYCLYGAAQTGLDADAISPFSFARDVLLRVPVATWNFPAPTFIFPDVLVSIPLVYLLRTPEKWFYVSACLQWFALVFILLAYVRTQPMLKTKINFAGIIYASLLINKIGGYFFLLPWVMLSTRMYVLVNHMSAALLALGFYLWLRTASSQTKLSWQLFGLSILFSLSAFSDLFFMLYFFSFVGANLLIEYKKIMRDSVTIKNVTLLFFAGCMGVVLNAYINPNFWVQLHHSYQTISISERFTHFASILFYKNGSMLFLFLPLILMACVKLSTLASEQKKTCYSLLLGLLFFLFMAAYTGMVIDKYAIRYFGIYFPVFVFVIVQLLPSLYYRIAMHIVVSLIALYFGFLFIHRMLPIRNNLYIPAIQRILDCPAFQHNSEGALVIATYWPAKIVYEQSNRVFRLQQTTFNLITTYHWIYNPSWIEAAVMQSPLSTKKTLYITHEASLERIKVLTSQPNATVICGGAVILIDGK